LDEQSYLPKATGDTFVSKLNEVYPKHQSYQRGKPQERETFRIHHYAGQVIFFYHIQILELFFKKNLVF